MESCPVLGVTMLFGVLTGGKGLCDVRWCARSTPFSSRRLRLRVIDGFVYLFFFCLAAGQVPVTTLGAPPPVVTGYSAAAASRRAAGITSPSASHPKPGSSVAGAGVCLVQPLSPLPPRPLPPSLPLICCYLAGGTLGEVQVGSSPCVCVSSVYVSVLICVCLCTCVCL